MAYNRYLGNTGRVVRVRDPEPEPAPPEMRPGPHAPPPGPVPAFRPATAPPTLSKPENFLKNGLGELLERLLPKELEIEDLLLLLIFYLLYRESGDEDFLILLGAMLFG